VSSTLADWLLAALLHRRLAWRKSPSPSCSAFVPNDQQEHPRHLPVSAPGQATSRPGPQRLTSLDDLYGLAETGGLDIPSQL
jgi:hypothetical protein